MNEEESVEGGMVDAEQAYGNNLLKQSFPHSDHCAGRSYTNIFSSNLDIFVTRFVVLYLGCVLTILIITFKHIFSCHISNQVIIIIGGFIIQVLIKD